jgi:predicted permease
VTLDLSLDSRVLSFSLAVSLFAGVLFGLFPALQSSKPDVVTTLKDEGTGGGRKRRINMRSVLVTTQVAVSTLLLVGAGLFVRSLLATQNLDPGFGQQATGMLNLFLPSTEYSQDQALRFYERLSDRLGEIPGVTAVGLIDNPNLTPTNQMSRSVNIDGVEPPQGRDAHAIDFAHIDENYFEAAGVPILEGRAFEPRDDGESPPVAIVSEAFVRRFFPVRDPIGARLRLSPIKPGDAPDFEIVGVAQDTRVRSLVEPPRPFLYLPIRQDFTPVAVFLATGPNDARQTAISMLQAARELDPDVRVLESKTMARHISTFLLPAEASAFFVGGFSLLALLLAVIGLYGLVSYSVAQRAREVGIRMAIGARPLEIIQLLMKGGLGLVLVGEVIGVALAALASRGLSGLLYGVPAADPLTFLLIPLVLLTVAVVATLVPAWRASRIDPVRVMRID